VVLIAAELKITTYVARWRPQLAGSVGHFVFAIGFFGYGLAGRSSALVIISTLFFVSGLMISGPSMFARPARAPAAVKARYVGTMQAVFGLASALGPALGVFAWSHLGNGIWPVCGVGGVLAGVLAFVGMTGTTASSPPAPPAETPKQAGAPEDTETSETVRGRA
jgi:predicted MFS family arabinose efflux permease